MIIYNEYNDGMKRYNIELEESDKDLVVEKIRGWIKDNKRVPDERIEIYIFNPYEDEEVPVKINTYEWIDRNAIV